MKLVKIIAVIFAGLILASCASGPKVSYGDATAVETTTTGFGSTDLQSIAAKLVDDLISFPPIIQMTAQRRPVVFVDRIKNKTTEHIDTESITDTISNKILRSGKFRFVDMTKVADVQRQMSYQKDSGNIDPATAIKMGRQIGAEYMMYGNLSSIVKRGGSSKDVYYKFTLKVLHVETGLIEWSDEKEIRKSSKKALFGL